MKTDTNPPTDLVELIEVKDLARKVYESRKNFTNLCEALEHLYAHFDKVEVRKAA